MLVLHVFIISKDVDIGMRKSFIFQVSPENGKRGYHAFFPPKTEKLETYFDRGFYDAVQFLKKEGYYQK